MSKAFASLRQKTLNTASSFKDYNFRTYFVNHTRDTFQAVENRNDAAEIKSFVKGQGKDMLDQMNRMVIINRMFATTPVMIDPRIGAPAKAKKASKKRAASPKA